METVSKIMQITILSMFVFVTGFLRVLRMSLN